MHAGVPLKQISAGGRTGTAIRDRHNKHLQVLPGYGTFVAASHEASKSVPVVVSPPPRASATTGNAAQEQLQQRLHSCDVSLPDGVDEELVEAPLQGRPGAIQGLRTNVSTAFGLKWQVLAQANRC
ncbi:hypothetical protein OAO87_03980 [bacterium]|nr:hypothetical protein [bacterium]